MTAASVTSSLDAPDSATRAMDVTPPKSDPTKTGYRSSSAPHASSAIVDATPGKAGQLDSALVESAVIETRVMGGVAGGDPANPSAGSTHTLKVVRFESLARCGDEIWIEHAGQLYRLRKTRQGKLILTK